MQLVVNGQNREADSGMTVTHLLEILDLLGRRVAVEVNGEIVPRSQYDLSQLQEGDRVEVVQAIGGGMAHLDRRCSWLNKQKRW